MPDPLAISNMIGRKDPMTLARPGLGPTVTVYAKRYQITVSDLDGNIQQGDRGFKFTDLEIAAAAWPGPPRYLDSLTTADGLIYTVQSVDTRRDGGVVLLHIVRAKGDA